MKLLIVEDNPHDAALIEMTLVSGGIDADLTFARDREGFVEGIGRGQDVVLLDHALGAFDALQALDIARAAGSDASFIVVSGSVGDEAAAECIKRGATDYVLKDRMGRLPQAVSLAIEHRQLQNETKAAHQRHRGLVERLPAVVYSASPGVDGEWLYCSAHIADLLGYSPQEWMSDRSLWYESLHSGDRTRVMEAEARALVEGSARTIEYRMFARDGRMRWIRDESILAYRDSETPVFEGLLFDITASKRSGDRSTNQALVLEMIARGSGLNDCLRAIATLMEESSIGSKAAIQLYDDVSRTLYGAVSSSLPKEFLTALDGLAIGPDKGSFGAAVSRKQSVYSSDIATDPVWAGLKDLAVSHGLSASWSVPILSGENDRVIGTLDMYYAYPRDPSLEELEIVDQAKRLATVTVEHEHKVREIRRSEARKSAVLEASLDCIVTMDHRGRIMEFNPAAERTFGFSKDQVIGREVAELLIPERLRASHRAGLSHQLSTQSSTLVAKRVELPALRSDGTEFLCEIAITQVDLPGNPVFTAFLRDVSEERATRDALRESEEVFRGAFRSSRLGLVLIRLNGEYIDVNDAFCQMVGYSKDELLTMTWLELTDPADRGKNVDQSNKLIQGQIESMFVTKRYIHKNGSTVWVEVSDAMVKDAEGRPSYIVTQVQDVTERYAAKRELEALQERSRQSQKMEAVGQLAGGIAHDFNNILSVVINYADFLSKTLGEHHDGFADVQEIRGAAERAARLVRQLLAFSRKEVVQVEAVDLREVLGGMRELLRRTLGEHITFAVDETDEPLHRISADPGQVEQILMNLAVNARDAMHAGGRLIISTSNFAVDEEGRGPGLPRGDYVRLVVADTGHGMETGTVERAFEPFFTTKERGQGTGLGLATVYGIVTNAKGHISIESESGKGTAFNIWFPAAPEEQEAHAPLPAIPPAPADRGLVLVVEDEEGVRRVVERVLTAAGYGVLAASSGEEALSLLSGGSVPDLLLSDVIMPEMSGKVLVELIRAKQPHLPVVYMSGYTDDIVASRGIVNGAEGFLQKPFEADQLLESVRANIEREAVA